MIDDRQGTPMTAAARSHRHRTLLAYAAASVALATLGACTGSDPGPAVTTPPSTSAVTSSATPTTTTSTSPNPTASVDPVIAKIPAAARHETEAGAVAFARYFFDSLNRAATAANPAMLDGLFESGCATCVAMSDSVSDLQRAGQHHSGPTIRILRVSTESFVPEKRVVVIDVDQAAVDVLNNTGKRVDRTLAAKGSFAMTLNFARNHWTVARLQTVAK